MFVTGDVLSECTAKVVCSWHCGQVTHGVEECMRVLGPLVCLFKNLNVHGFTVFEREQPTGSPAIYTVMCLTCKRDYETCSEDFFVEQCYGMPAPSSLYDAAPDMKSVTEVSCVPNTPVRVFHRR